MDLIETINRCICDNYSPTIVPGPVLFVAAHPDDETIGAAGLLQRIKRAHFVHITNGAPRDLADAELANFTSREGYAQARRHELQEAIAWAGLETICQLQCNVTDQETTFNMAGIACRLERIIEEVQPTFIFTHAYEGGHPDHDTASFVVWAACKLLKRKKKIQPIILEFSSYHGSGSGPEMIACEFIHSKGCTEWISNLTEKERDIKRKMMACFKSQKPTVSLFSVGVERFRISPNYNYHLRPHDGPLYYEFFDWGITGDKWREKASEAMLLLKVGR